MKTDIKTTKRVRRHKKIRSQISGSMEMPRLSVHKSNRYISAQLIDDVSGKTLVGSSSLKMKGSKTEQAQKVGKEIAEKAKEHKISKVVFDRGGFIYAGRVKTLAESAREAGLKF